MNRAARVQGTIDRAREAVKKCGGIGSDREVCGYLAASVIVLQDKLVAQELDLETLGHEYINLQNNQE